MKLKSLELTKELSDTNFDRRLERQRDNVEYIKNINGVLIHEVLLDSGIFHAEVDLLAELINIESDKIFAVNEKLFQKF